MSPKNINPKNMNPEKILNMMKIIWMKKREGLGNTNGKTVAVIGKVYILGKVMGKTALIVEDM